MTIVETAIRFAAKFQGTYPLLYDSPWTSFDRPVLACGLRPEARAYTLSLPAHAYVGSMPPDSPDCTWGVPARAFSTFHAPALLTWLAAAADAYAASRKGQGGSGCRASVKRRRRRHLGEVETTEKRKTEMQHPIYF
jgi:hypothetical protein